MKVFYRKFISNTIVCNTLSQYPDGSCLIHRENLKLLKIFRVETGNRFPSLEAKKQIGDDIKIQQGELTNVLR